MTPENHNKPNPDLALGAYIQAGKVLADKKSSEIDVKLAVVGMLGAYAFMNGTPVPDIFNEPIDKKKGN